MADMLTSYKVVAVVEGTGEIKNLDNNISKLGKDSQKSGEKVDELGNKTSEMTDDLKKATEQVKQSTIERNKLNSSLSSTIKRYAGMAAVAATIKKATSEYISFDDQARKVGATVGANAEQMKALSAQARQLGAETVWNATQSAEAQFEFAKAGFSVNEILKATPSILNIATVGQMSLAEATSITAGAIRMFGLSAADSTRVGDVLAKTANSTTTDMAGLGESLKYAGLEAKGMGLSLEETATILGTLGNMKIDSSMAGTGLRRVFASLKEEAKQQKLINIGVQLTEDGKFRNFLDIFKDVKEKTKGMAEAQRDSFLADVFGTQGNVVMKAMIESNEEDFDKLLASLENAEGYSQTVAEAFNSGLGGAFKGLSSAVSELSISFIDMFAPSISVVVKGITGLVGTISGFFRSIKDGTSFVHQFIQDLKDVNEKSGMLKPIILGLTAGVTAYTISLIAMKTATVIATIATWSLNAAMAILTAPITLIVAGVVAFGAGMYMLYQRSENFRRVINPLIEKLKEMWEWVKKFNFVGKAIDKVKSLVGIKDKKEDETVGEKTKKGTGSKTVANAVKGKNTDYLLGSIGSVGNTTTSATSNNTTSNYVHNGYYLKGSNNNDNTKNENKTVKSVVNNKNETKAISNTNNDNTNTENIYNSISENAAPEQTFEEKILDAILSIKELLSKGGSSNTTNVTINNSDADEEISKMVDDLILAVSNK